MATNKELQAKLEKEKGEIILPAKKETIGSILKNKRLETGKTIDSIYHSGTDILWCCYCSNVLGNQADSQGVCE